MSLKPEFMSDFHSLYMVLFFNFSIMSMWYCFYYRKMQHIIKLLWVCFCLHPFLGELDDTQGGGYICAVLWGMSRHLPDRRKGQSHGAARKHANIHRHATQWDQQCYFGEGVMAEGVKRECKWQEQGEILGRGQGQLLPRPRYVGYSVWDIAKEDSEGEGRKPAAGNGKGNAF